jgi:hypothetical protein
MVAAMTESDPGELKQTPEPTPWLTGTVPRGGQGIWRFSLMKASFDFVGEPRFQRLKFIGIPHGMVGVSSS